MDINCYIAMTTAEILSAKALPLHIGWLGCHFSQRNTGLCDLPSTLPKNTLLILDDSTPPAGHDPELVVHQLTSLIRKLDTQTVILDFQRPGQAETIAMATYLIKALPCTVCVAAPYAKKHSCPVLLPAPAPHVSLENHLAPWKSRQLWMEATLDTVRITVTEQGSVIDTLSYIEPDKSWFTEDRLCCRYRIREWDTSVEFTITRDTDMLKKLLGKARMQGVTNFLGLYQQLG